MLSTTNSHYKQAHAKGEHKRRAGCQNPYPSPRSVTKDPTYLLLADQKVAQRMGSEIRLSGLHIEVHEVEQLGAKADAVVERNKLVKTEASHSNGRRAAALQLSLQENLQP